MKIRPVGVALFHADGQTDRQSGMSKLTIASCSFANAPKNALYAKYLRFLYLLRVARIITLSLFTCLFNNTSSASSFSLLNLGANHGFLEVKFT
jgi:hypothetical protein